jgi:hypothetical protein
MKKWLLMVLPVIDSLGCAGKSKTLVVNSPVGTLELVAKGRP